MKLKQLALTTLTALSLSASPALSMFVPSIQSDSGATKFRAVAGKSWQYQGTLTELSEFGDRFHRQFHLEERLEGMNGTTLKGYFFEGNNGWHHGNTRGLREGREYCAGSWSLTTMNGSAEYSLTLNYIKGQQSCSVSGQSFTTVLR